jgi:hypothetical protein
MIPYWSNKTYDYIIFETHNHFHRITINITDNFKYVLHSQ